MNDLVLTNNTTECIIKQKTISGHLITNICSNSEYLVTYTAGDFLGMALFAIVSLALIMLIVLLILLAVTMP